MRNVKWKLSVIFGTYNRAAVLRRCIEAIRKDLDGRNYEIVVTDGGSTDGSREWLAVQDDVVLVGLRHLGGAVEAFNHAYAASRGDFIATLNDDAAPVGGALRNGVEFLLHRASAGQVAIRLERTRGAEPKVEILYPGSAYANFGVVRRKALEQVVRIQGGFWNPCYRTYGADCELSAWLHHLGWGVDPMEDPALGYIEDYEVHDVLRRENHTQGRAQRDGQLFWKRWGGDTHAMLRGKLKPNVTEAELRRLGEVVAEPSVRAAEPDLEVDAGRPPAETPETSTVE